VVAVLLLLLSLLPVAIRLGAVSWLQDHGAPRAEIENIDLNPFTGTFAIEGLSAGDGLKIGRLAVNVDWWPLFSRHLFLHSLELKAVTANLHQREDGNWQLGPISLPAAAPASAEESKTTSEPWQVLFNHIDAADLKLKVKGSIDRQAFELTLPLKRLNVSSVKEEKSGAQLLKNSCDIGHLRFSGFGYRLENRELQLEHAVSLPAQGDNFIAGIRLDGLKVKSAGLILFDTGSELRMLALEGIALEQGSVDGAGSGAFARLALHGIGLPEAGKDSLGRIDKIELLGGTFDAPGSYRLEKIAVQGLQAALKRAKDGTIPVVDRFQPSGKMETPVVAEAGAADADKAKFALHAGEFSVSAGSRMTYRDESLSPALETAIEVERFALAPIDTTGSESGLLELSLRLGKNGSLTAGGSIVADVENPHSKLTVAIKNFDMPKLSGFVEKGFGQAIKTGQFNMESTIQIAGKKVETKNRLLIRKLVLEKGKRPGTAEKRVGMPVDVALDMLRDSRGDIAMDVPVSGRLDDPDIDITDAINKALAKAMSAGALAYAKLALQPYGAIIMAVEVAAGTAQKAGRPKLTPVRFGERSAALAADMEEYAQKISALMRQKDFRLQVCGVATRIEGGGATPDRPRIMDDEKLLSLAEARSDAVIHAIQGQGIAADRLFSCRPRIDEKARESLPRVELIFD